MDNIPDLTHLQFLAVDAVVRGPRSGREVRLTFERFGVFRSLSSFYQMMARLEESGYVAGEYRQDTAGGVPVKERYYTITLDGVAARQAVLDFYAALRGD